MFLFVGVFLQTEVLLRKVKSAISD